MRWRLIAVVALATVGVGGYFLLGADGTPSELGSNARRSTWEFRSDDAPSPESVEFSIEVYVPACIAQGEEFPTAEVTDVEVTETESEIVVSAFTTATDPEVPGDLCTLSTADGRYIVRLNAPVGSRTVVDGYREACGGADFPRPANPDSRCPFPGG